MTELWHMGFISRDWHFAGRIVMRNTKCICSIWGFHFKPEHGHIMFVRNVNIQTQGCMVQKPRRPQSEPSAYILDYTLCFINENKIVNF